MSPSLEVAQDNGNFVIAQGSVLSNPDEMENIRILVVELPASADKRIAVGSNAILVFREDLGWRYKFTSATGDPFYIPPLSLMGMKFRTA
jgi:hypothetical protein